MKVFDWIQDLCLSCYCSGTDSASLGDSYFGFLNFSSYTKSLKKGKIILFKIKVLLNVLANKVL